MPSPAAESRLPRARGSAERLERLGAKDGRVVGQQACGFAVLLEDRDEHVNRGRTGRPRDPPQGKQPSAVVVDDAYEPHGDEAQQPDERDIEPPQ